MTKTERGCDFHVHTTRGAFPYWLDRRSDIMDLESLFKTANTLGLEAIAVTNHDSIKKREINQAMNVGEKFGVIVIPGVELTSTLIGHLRLPHIIALGITPDEIERQNENLPRLINFKSPWEVTKWIEDLGGITIIPHSPGKDRADARVSLPQDWLKYLARENLITGLETRGLFIRGWPDEDPEIIKIANLYNLAEIAGSDTHPINRMPRRLGVVRTKLRTNNEIRDWQQIISLIKQGNTETAVGTLYHNGKEIKEFPSLEEERKRLSVFNELRSAAPPRTR